jgi:hypothetical protein
MRGPEGACETQLGAPSTVLRAFIPRRLPGQRNGNQSDEPIFGGA